MRSPRIPAIDGELALLVAVTLALNACGITWGLPGDVDWAIDSVAPVGPLVYAHQMLATGHWWSKYPPFHLGVLALLDAPYLALLTARGSFHAGATHFPYGFADPAVALGALTLIARTLSAAMGVGAAAAAYAMGRELHGRRAGLIAGLLFAASPLTLYYADTGNLDVPYVFWSGLALLALVRVARGAEPRAYVAAGVCSALAVATKDQAYGLFLLLLPLVVAHVRHRQRPGLVDPRLLRALVAAIATYAVAANVLLDWPGWCTHFRYITHEGSAPYRMFPATVAGYARLAARCVRLTADSLTWPVTALAAAGAWRALRDRVRGATVPLIALLSYFATFVGAIVYVFPRFVLPAVLVLSVFAGMAGARLWEAGTRPARAAVVAAVGWAILNGASMNLGLLLDSRYAAEAWMADHIPPTALVGTNGGAVYLPRLPRDVRTIAVDIDGSGPVPRGDAPEFLILSDAYYRRYLRHQETRPVVRALLAGGLGYERLAVFHRRWLPATALIPTVNPRIVILRRRA